MSNMGKGAGYYLTRSKSLLIDTAIVAILAIFMSFAMQMDTLQSKGEDYLVLMLYAVIFGLTSLQSGAMIVDLTAKDKLSRRIEFFAASGIAVKEIIKQYSIQIFRFSGIIPFFVFMSCYYFTDWTMSFGRIVCVYLSILVLSFCEIVALNIIVLDVKRVKRIEWKLANGIKISSIVKENLLSLWIGTLILLFPLLLIISIRLPNLILLLGTYFLILSILYSAFINVLILWIRNMNWFKSIPIFATLLHILLVVLKCGIFMKTNNVWVLLLFSPVSIIVLTACGLCLMTKERIVSSYY